MASLNLGLPIPIKTNLYNVLSISDPSCSKLARDMVVNFPPSIMHLSGLSLLTSQSRYFYFYRGLLIFD